MTRLQTATGTLTTSDIEMAGTMNQAFNRVFTQEDTLDMPTPTGAPLQEELIQVQIHQERVRNCLNAVKENNVPGPDGVSPVILKA